MFYNSLSSLCSSSLVLKMTRVSMLFSRCSR